ncbi:MAG: response regulator transcription factor [Sediminicola sp.]
MKTKKILLVEDDPKVCHFINQGLKEAGFDLSIALNGRQGYEMAKDPVADFDLLILDIMLPDMNGLEICKAIREKDTNIPILFLTALGSSENIALGLNSGADDYLSKPFKFIELLARINSLLRRSGNGTSSTKTEEDVFAFAELEVNDRSKTVKVHDQSIKLTYTEYKLLLTLIKSPNRVFPQNELLDRVWGMDYDIGTNVVNVYINYLRKKLEKANAQKLIHTVIGMGYVLKMEDEDTE